MLFEGLLYISILKSHNIIIMSYKQIIILSVTQHLIRAYS